MPLLLITIKPSTLKLRAVVNPYFYTMKQLLLFLLIAPSAFSAEIVMPRVDPELFIHHPQTDLDLISVKNEALKVKMVRALFDNDQLDHMDTKAFDPAARFEPYYAKFGRFYRLSDLDNDNTPELIFNSVISEEDDREFLEIYRYEKTRIVNLYKEIGHVLAYKIQPNTGEILLFHHGYPCCANASHNLNRLRLVGGKIRMLKRYFLARERDMKGKFFPDSIRVNKRYNTSYKRLELRWSGEVISKDAWYRRNPDNVIAHYEAPVVYKVLAEEDGWYFVLVNAAPLKEPSYVINADNLKETWVYGWVDKRKV